MLLKYKVRVAEHISDRQILKWENNISSPVVFVFSRPCVATAVFGVSLDVMLREWSVSRVVGCWHDDHFHVIVFLPALGKYSSCFLILLLLVREEVPLVFIFSCCRVIAVKNVSRHVIL